jgi:hypothetical protein
MNRTCLILALTASTVLAQPGPQFAWQGQVDGVSILHVRGTRTDIEDRQGNPVQKDRFRFFDRLPELKQNVRMEVLEGRGNIRIIEQPSPNNNYTLSVQIEDKQPGAGLYSLVFYWQSGGGSQQAGYFAPRHSEPRTGEDRLTWSGRVDEEVDISCRGNDCRPESLRGQPVMRDRFVFSRPLPSAAVRVRLDDVQGRGDVRIMEQPSENNGYTTKIRVRDSQSGAGDYAFSLFWNQPSRMGPDRLFGTTGVVWYGRVDGKIRVIVQDGSASVDVISGTPVTSDNASFKRALARQPAPNATVRRVRGRGEVYIVEYPSGRNGFRLVFEINDTDGGADNYEVEVVW